MTTVAKPVVQRYLATRHPRQEQRIELDPRNQGLNMNAYFWGVNRPVRSPRVECNETVPANPFSCAIRSSDFLGSHAHDVPPNKPGGHRRRIGIIG